MTWEWLRTVGPVLLAVATAFAVDRLTVRRGLDPPGFRAPPGWSEREVLLPPLRRAAALFCVALVLWLGAFAPLGMLGRAPQPVPELSTPQLFALHGFFAAALAIWYLLGFAGQRARGSSLLSAWIGQFGLRAREIWRELALGVGVGLAAWVAVLTTLIVLGVLIWMVGGEEALPSEPPPLVVWVAALPLSVRVAVSLSAGVVEEIFFRGFLQPRVGIGLSSGLFVLAHLSYEQPLMLVGVALLSLIFAFLVQWRQSIWAAIAAHAVFDGMQLLVVIPRLLEMLRGQGMETLAGSGIC